MSYIHFPTFTTPIKVNVSHFITGVANFAYYSAARRSVCTSHKISDLTEKVHTKREFDWLKEEIEK